MPTRKEQIEAFKKAHMKEKVNKVLTGKPNCTFMKCTREEFLAYAFIRGRNYRQQERMIRKDNEPHFEDIMRALTLNFPEPDPVPVPVGPGGEEEPKEPRKYPWPELDYENGIQWQLGDWMAVVPQDQVDWEDKEHAHRVAAAEKLKADRAKYTPEYIEELRAKARK